MLPRGLWLFGDSPHPTTGRLAGASTGRGRVPGSSLMPEGPGPSWVPTVTWAASLLPYAWLCRSVVTPFSPSSSSNMADSKAKAAKAANKTPPKSPGDSAKDRAAKRLSLETEGAGEGAAAAAPELSALEEAFRRFAVHGDTRATGREMHGKNWSKLCKDCQVIDGKNVTVTDVDIVFSKIK